MNLGVEEQLGVDDVVGVGAGEVGHRERREVLAVAEDVAVPSRTLAAPTRSGSSVMWTRGA
jgi:hypothetical protein